MTRGQHCLRHSDCCATRHSEADSSQVRPRAPWEAPPRPTLGLGLGLGPGRQRTPPSPTPGLGLGLGPGRRRTPPRPTPGLGLSLGPRRRRTPPRPTQGSDSTSASADGLRLARPKGSDSISTRKTDPTSTSEEPPPRPTQGSDRPRHRKGHHYPTPS
jgi:hypothetical protein